MVSAPWTVALHFTPTTLQQALTTHTTHYTHHSLHTPLTQTLLPVSTEILSHSHTGTQQPPYTHTYTTAYLTHTYTPQHPYTHMHTTAYLTHTHTPQPPYT